jgi:hypothetical protein
MAGGSAVVAAVWGEGSAAVSVNNLTLTPDRDTVVAAIHGRGLWQITLR